MSNKATVILVIGLFLAVAVGAYWFGAKSRVTPGEVATEAPLEETVPGGIEESKEEEATGAGVVEERNVGEEMAKLLARKFSKAPAAVTIRVNQEALEHAMGLVSFEGEIGGGWWLAAKVGGEWVLVADGNGAIICADIDPYDFPTDMVPECYDEAAGKLRVR